jgi:hypothetical protein
MKAMAIATAMVDQVLEEGLDRFHDEVTRLGFGSIFTD